MWIDNLHDKSAHLLTFFRLNLKPSHQGSYEELAIYEEAEKANVMT